MHKKIKIRVACGAIEVGGPYGMTSWQPIYKDIEVDVGDDPTMHKTTSLLKSIA